MESTKNPIVRPPPVIRKVKDMDPDSKFADIHPYLPQMPSLLLIIGSVRSGKSNLITNLFCNPDFYKDKFEVVRIISTTLHTDQKGKILDKHFDCSSYYEDSMIHEIKQSQSIYKPEEDGVQRPTFALVLDDVLTKDFSKSNEVSFFSTRFRHYIDMYIIATQTFRAVSGLIRNNATDVVICRQQNQKELQKIAEEYAGSVGGEENFMRMYKEIHSTPYQVMYLKLSENPAHIYRNFEELIYPTPSNPEKTGFD
tara:strand:- start:251 stop:1012 length:762 start_codon:yes stop_codon:yes gene_type:complete